MDDVQQFILAASRAGYSSEAAAVALAWACDCLGQVGQSARLYVFRSASSGGGGSGQTAPGRSRVLLAFRSADTALSFAQSNGLSAAPRLATLGLGQLLAALIQHPTIATLLVASEAEDALHASLPNGARIERAALLDQLQIADCRL
jgi:hypothetical protein